MHFSVILPVHGTIPAQSFELALASMLQQDVCPQEIVVVADGPLTAALEEVLQQMAPSPIHIHLVRLPHQLGLGRALNAGLAASKCEWIARMDADDWSPPTRFERQVGYLATHPNLDLLGGQIAEFTQDHRRPTTTRICPLTQEAILAQAPFRNPINHVTVMVRKSQITGIGGYRHMPGFEDYDLWIRMLQHGAHMHNLEDVLVHVRMDPGFAARRGGLAYIRDEWAFQRSVLDMGFCSRWTMLRNLLVRTPVRLVPGRWRNWLYRRLLRSAG